jgi:hypothetical protein
MAVVINGDTGITSVNGTAAAPSITGADTNTGIVYGTDTLSLATGGVAAVTIDSSQNVGIGTSSPSTALEAYASGTSVTIRAAADSGTPSVQSARYSTDTSAPVVQLLKYRGTVASPTIVASGDITGRVLFYGYDGAGATIPTSEIRSYVDGAPGATDMPGRLSFWTTADGASSSTEQARIDSSGNFQFNSGYGSVTTAYGCRAWVNFNGTGTVATRGSGNVSSVSDRGVGLYTVNFSTAMPDENYSAVVTCKPVNAAGSIVFGCLAYYGLATNPTLTGSVAVDTRAGTAGVVDSPYVCVSVFR